MTAAGDDSHADWRPTASREMLELRAALLARTRSFFAARRVLEVDTPIVVNAPVTDVHIHSARVIFEAAGPGQATPQPYYLHTSPEYAMKRLLAAGAGDIFQICHVVRALERGR
ncbi:MAG TPA: amino acid--tRNA ligase-related protein, partial [Steroidobacteraceae bacterium]|nr:amino acid--tRNA ligase-related protein [Steroidobacteraceae bacterium]